MARLPESGFGTAIGNIMTRGTRGVLVAFLVSSAAAADDRVFEVHEVPVRERVVAAELADFNGDGRSDLMVATIDGIPPEERRRIRIFFRGRSGTLPPIPQRTLDIPPFSAMYDIADITDRPGEEIVFLRPDRVTIASLASKDPVFHDIAIDGPSTAAASSDERGFDIYRLVYGDFGDRPLLLIPQIGRLTAISPDGELIARMDVDRRANFFIVKPASMIAFESDIQVFLDLPRTSVGDVDGDGRADIVSATRHEIRTFLQDAEGRFADQPSFVTDLDFITEEDHLRGSGGLATSARDIDEDGRLDLLISHVEGALTDTVTTTYVYRNRGGRWDIDNPDERYSSDKTLSSDLLLNIDRGPELELVRIQLKFTILELVELLLQRKIDAQIAIHQLDEGGYGEKPWSERKISTGFSFETFRPRGFMPRGEIDLNGDGYMDFVTSADGDGIEIWLGGEDGPFDRRAAYQEFPSAGRIRFADANGDELPDFLLFDPQTPGAPVRIGTNLGRLEGTVGAPLVADGPTENRR